MALQRILVRQNEEQRCTLERVQLDGTRYRFRFRYSAASRLWAFDLSADDGTALLAGIDLVLGVDLLAQFRHLAVPPGQLFAYNTLRIAAETERPDVEAGLDGFDARVLLLYRPAAEVVA